MWGGGGERAIGGLRSGAIKLDFSNGAQDVRRLLARKLLDGFKGINLAYTLRTGSRAKAATGDARLRPNYFLNTPISLYPTHPITYGNDLALE